MKEQPLNKIKPEEGIWIKDFEIRDDLEQITIDKIIASSLFNGLNNNSESNDLISLNEFTFQQ